MNEAVREFLHILFKRKRFVVITFAAVAIPAVLMALLRSPTYRASAKLLISGARSYLHISPQDSRKGTQIPDSQILFAEMENLKNRSFLLSVASRLQVEILDPVPDDKDMRTRQTASKIAQDLVVTAYPKTPMLEVAFTASDKHIAAAVVNTVIDAYLEYHPSLYESPEVEKFYEKRGDELRRDLRRAETRLDRFQRSSGIINLTQQLDEMVRQTMAVELELEETDGLTHQTKNLIAELERSLQSEPERVASDVNMVNNPVARALEERIGLLTVELSELRQRYTNEDRRVRDKLQQIAELQAQVDHQPERIVGSERFERNPVHQNLTEELLRAKANTEALAAKQETLAASLVEFRSRMHGMDTAGSELREFEAQVAQTRSALEQVVKREQEAELSMQMSADKLDSIRIVDRAQPPPNPINRNLPLTILVALLAGGALGIAGAFGLEFLYQTYHFGSDVERELEIPVLGLISDFQQTS